MIERWHLWSNDRGEAGVYLSWLSWTFGAELDIHPFEWTLQVHVGPVRVMLMSYRPRARARVRKHMDDLLD